jgi:F-type H+-transporting ATPase subunit a
MHIPSIVPDKVAIFGGVQVSETLITAYCATAVIIVLGLLFKFVFIKKFTQAPKGLQNLLEMAIGGVRRFSVNVLGEKAGEAIAPYMLTIYAFVILGGLTEYVGIRSPATDLNCTIALALITFVLIIAFAVRYRGVFGWLKSYAHPKAIMVPFNIIASVTTPVSLACRMFGNLFSGLLIMDLIYGGMGDFAIAVPALASLYLIMFHIAMQSYVFTTLTLNFIQERME